MAPRCSLAATAVSAAAIVANTEQAPHLPWCLAGLTQLPAPVVASGGVQQRGAVSQQAHYSQGQLHCWQQRSAQVGLPLLILGEATRQGAHLTDA